MSIRIDCADGRERDRAMSAATAAVKRGQVVVIPTEGSYAVAADAFSATGMAALRALKGHNEHMPLPVMVAARSTVAGVAARVGASAERLMDAFWPGQLTLIFTPQPSLAWSLPKDSGLAIRMPLHPVALALLAGTGPLAVTAANLPGMPLPTSIDDVLDQLGDGASVILDAGVLADTAPSTVVDCTGPTPILVREGAVSWSQIERVCSA